VVICEKRHYLRGRELEEMNEILRAGVAEGGYRGPVESFPTEVEALEILVSHAKRGDVVAVMSHAERPDVFRWLASEAFTPVDADRLRKLLGS
jgi:cyanophycin synthetase